ncbi:MAG: hypothetical protein GY788_02805 [bacterium]|nr:hypothetical protein [bacterium]
MTSYTGSLRIAATADVIDAQFHIDTDRLEIQTGSDRLGSWSLDQLIVERRGDGIHLDLDGEDVVVDVPDTEAFVSEVAPSGRRNSKHKKRHAGPKPSAEAKRPKAAKEGPSPLARLAGIKEIFFRENWTRWLSDNTVRWAIASGAVVLFALMALFATNTLGMILVLFGMVALIVAALAVSDDLSAYSWVPGELSETGLVIAGAIAMVIGGLLIALG